MLSVKWYGTMSLEIKYNNQSLIIDPFIRYNKRNDKAFISNMSKYKNIIITHGHIDHTVDLPNLYKNKKCKIYCTKCVCKRLIKNNLTKHQLVEIKPNDSFKINNFNIKVYKSKHINFDLILVLKTVFSKDIFKYFKNLLFIIKNNFVCREKKQTVAYSIIIDDKSFFVLGSMNLDKNTKYPKNIDYLILAYQGRSDLDKNVNDIIERINPKNVILSHFDNSFPPVSKDVNISNLKNIINKNINIIIPVYDKDIVLTK